MKSLRCKWSEQCTVGWTTIALCGRHTFGTQQTLRHDLTVEVQANASSSLAYDLVHKPGPVTFAEVTTE